MTYWRLWSSLGAWDEQSEITFISDEKKGHRANAVDERSSAESDQYAQCVYWRKSQNTGQQGTLGAT